MHLLVLADLGLTIDLTTVQEVVASLQADVDNILEIRGPEPNTAPVKTAEVQWLLHFSMPLLHHQLSIVSVPSGIVPSAHPREMRLLLGRKSGQILRQRGKPH